MPQYKKATTVSPIETPKKRSPTVVDVARHAKVSQGTVSRYLNGLPIKADNKERVVAAIATLKYSPNAVAAPCVATILG